MSVRIYPVGRSSDRPRRSRRTSRWLALESLERRDLLSAADPSFAAAEAGLQHLRDVMDQYHHSVPVYDDIGSAGNHFHARAMIPDQSAAVSMNGSWTVNPQSGATCIRFEFQNTTGTNFGGFYLQNGVMDAGQLAPQLNWGTVPDAGVDLSGAVTLRFWARGEHGGERIEFFHGGIGRDAVTGLPHVPYPDSSVRFPPVGTIFTLSSDWELIEIDVSHLDLSYTLGLGWVANAPNNPQGAVFYVDNIEYVLGPEAQQQRLNEPRFLRSFVTHDIQADLSDDDRSDDIHTVLRNAASVYDNSLVILSFLADHQTTENPDSLRRAALIGDALVYASQNDRTFDDGRLRSWYAAGNLTVPPGWNANGRPNTPAVPGFYEESTQTFYEVEQRAFDTGNNAWAMIALLALHRVTGDTRYLDTALEIGEFLEQFQNTEGRFQGLVGGLAKPDGEGTTDAGSGVPSELEDEAEGWFRRVYASTEHNLDLVRAFDMAYDATADLKWYGLARHAEAFVAAMKDETTGGLMTGTHDLETRNESEGQLPLDVQAWFVLVFPDAGQQEHYPVLAFAEERHRTVDQGFDLYDFNDDRDGVWFEGSAHMSLAYSVAGRFAEAGAINAQLQHAQQTAPFGDGQGIVAATRDGLTTGFGFEYFRVLHIGATAFHIMAQLGYNPYYQEVVLGAWQNSANPLDVNADSKVTPLDVLETINYINLHGTHRLAPVPTPPQGPPPLVDVSGDGWIQPLDILLVINWLNWRSAEAESGHALQVWWPGSEPQLGTAEPIRDQTWSNAIESLDREQSLVGFPAPDDGRLELLQALGTARTPASLELEEILPTLAEDLLKVW